MPGRPVVLLGPQRLAPTLADAVRETGIHGRIAAVTAGWEEREAEDAELRDHLGGRTTNLEIWQRTEDVFAHDRELFEAMLDRYDRLQELQRLYRLRLGHVLGAARTLLRMKGDSGLLEGERSDAVEQVRRLDAQHLARVRGLHAEFRARYAPRERDHVRRHRSELGRILGACEALCVAGGHVGILLNRLRLFDVLGLASDHPIFAWSAGAMALSETVVLFHDSPPQGPGDAEVLEAGLGVFAGLVPLPHAKRRLRLDDTTRVGLFARRFGPALCVALDEGTRLVWNGAAWSGLPGTQRLTPDGALEEVLS